MYPLREIVHTATLQHDYAATFASLLLKLKESHIEVETKDEAKGIIVARCLTLVVDCFWRAWSDKLLLQVKRIDATATQVQVYAIPNLLRFKVGKNEEAIGRTKLIGQIFG